MLDPGLYTETCTKPVISPSPLAASLVTLDQWRQAYRDGAAPSTLLHSLRARLATGLVDPAVIRLVSRSELDTQISALLSAAESAVAAHAGVAQLPLFGVPFAVKDNIDIEGIATTAACPAFAYVAARDAAVIRRLQAAGAIWIAKTNLDQFATGLVGTRSPYGAPASCLAADRISGGSSSGSAVLVSRGDVPFSLGTDTAGSGRIPAAFNQIVGLKPTPGRVGSSGVVPACRSLDCVSVFAHTVDDAAAVLALIEGEDGDDVYNNFAPGPAAWPARLRVGIPAAPAFFGDAGYAAAWATALARLDGLGPERIDIDFSVLEAVGALLYDGPWVAERHLVVATLLNERPEAIDAAVRQVIGAADSYDADDAFRGQYRLRELAGAAARIWQRCDVLMVPTSPGHPRFADVAADPIGSNAKLGRYTSFVNLLGWCALALPAGSAAHGLPFGVTFVAPANHDAALAKFARTWQRTLDLPLGATTAHAVTNEWPSGPWPKSEAMLELAVVGAHLSGLPLNGELLERGATLVETTRTAPRYRLHAVAGTVPPKPGLVRDDAAGTSIEVEVWALPQREVGAFLALVRAPLGIGSVELASGRTVHGFLCEGHAVTNAPDISAGGGWRAFLATLL